MNLFDYKTGDVVLLQSECGQNSNQQGGERLALIISSNVANANLETVIVCPLTDLSGIRKSQVGVALVSGKEFGRSQNLHVLCLQILTVFKDRITKRLGSLPQSAMAEVHESLRFVLDLEQSDGEDGFALASGNGVRWSHARL